VVIDSIVTIAILMRKLEATDRKINTLGRDATRNYDRARDFNMSRIGG
jgi:hypothetical protein